MIVEDFKGEFPKTRADVLKLKGIGPYTVASFLALAFNLPETVIDGNVSRIIARLYHLTQPLDDIRQEIYIKACALTSHSAPADYASAIMDLGATVCTPKQPLCQQCPWHTFCKSCGLDDIEQIPQRKKISKVEKNGSVYLIYNSKGEVLIRKRTEKGLLSGLYEFPWCDNGNMFDVAQNLDKSVVHIFTHIKLTLNIYTFKTNISPIHGGFFIKISELNNYAFSTLMKKVWKKRA
jgi:A/G-specific adenine glycosylase